ncbi:MAG: anthranilate phosphoribosyltransferase [Deltaproteobacteria bacterium]|nr:anthranilate phosphoribosyltransferase [Deltaproteobacteria bacterium]MBW2418220.1 anthranilate phosphoribosyltransferase [Deltaproteobacteria bacterium]
MTLRAAIEIATDGQEVPQPVLEAAFGEIMDGEAEPVQIAALLVALRTKGESVGEIVATARALRARATTCSVVDPRTVDTCGTGGSGLDTFNISTTAAFVVAGAGVPVAKHGNRAASGRSGSFDVFEALGVDIDLPIETCGRILAEVGIGAFYARVAHPAFRFIAPVRQQLGIRTLMNCLGPLLNPAGARHQLVGVYARELVEPLASSLGALGARRALVVHGNDGMDEITTTGSSFGALFDEGALRSFEIEPARLGIPLARLEELSGGDPAQNAEITRAILAGESGPRRDIVLLNAAGALWAAGAAADLAEGLELARRSIDGGAAAASLEALVRASREAA